MEVRYETLESHAVDLGDGAVVLDYWNRVRGDRFAPAWGSQFRLTDLPTSIVPNLTVIDRIDGGHNFFYRFWGTNHATLKGFEMTGKTIDRTPSRAIQQIATRQLETVIQRRRPTVFLYSVDYPNRHRKAEFVLRLPLSTDGTRVDGVVTYQDLTSPAAHWDEVVQMVWPERHAHDGA